MYTAYQGETIDTKLTLFEPVDLAAAIEVCVGRRWGDLPAENAIPKTRVSCKVQRISHRVSHESHIMTLEGEVKCTKNCIWDEGFG